MPHSLGFKVKKIPDFLRSLVEGSVEYPDPYLHVSAASGSDKMARIHANPDPQL